MRWMLVLLVALLLAIGFAAVFWMKPLECVYAKKLPECHDSTTQVETVVSTTTETKTFCVFLYTTTLWNTTTVWTTTTIAD
ncbi:MAG: hypothetical protein QXH51_07940 [Candidatus Bathyarchaeia archaeon]